IELNLNGIPNLADIQRAPVKWEKSQPYLTRFNADPVVQRNQDQERADHHGVANEPIGGTLLVYEVDRYQQHEQGCHHDEEPCEKRTTPHPVSPGHALPRSMSLSMSSPSLLRSVEESGAVTASAASSNSDRSCGSNS